MVTTHHEALHRLFRDRPETVPSVFRALGVPLRDDMSYTEVSPDATELRPLERRIDTVLRVDPPDAGEGSFLLAVESQGRKDDGKPVAWSYYVSYLAAKYECEVVLLVVTQDGPTARWAAGPFTVGTPGWETLRLRPLVAGPASLPCIVNPTAASQDVPLALASVAAHGNARGYRARLDALATALGAVDEETAAIYADYVEWTLGDTPALKFWRDLMPIRSIFPDGRTLIGETLERGRVEGLEQGREEGREEGQVFDRAQMILRLLERRELPVSDAVRARIEACADLEMLGVWFDRAFDVPAAELIFGDPDA